jgi:hypothetical protein
MGSDAERATTLRLTVWDWTGKDATYNLRFEIAGPHATFEENVDLDDPR